MEELLPIGSIIEVNRLGRLMIIGYLPNKPNDEVFNDYICTRKEIGIKKNDKELELNKDYYYVKSDDIIEVKYIGYRNKSFDFFEMLYNKIKRKIIKLKEEKNQLEEEEISKVYEDIAKDIESMKGDKSEE